MTITRRPGVPGHRPDVHMPRARIPQGHEMCMTDGDPWFTTPTTHRFDASTPRHPAASSRTGRECAQDQELEPTVAGYSIWNSLGGLGLAAGVDVLEVEDLILQHQGPRSYDKSHGLAAATNDIRPVVKERIHPT